MLFHGPTGPDPTGYDLAGLGGRHEGMVPEIDGEGGFEREAIGLPFSAQFTISPHHGRLGPDVETAAVAIGQCAP